MKKFLIKIILFFIPLFLATMAVIYNADGSSDAFYIRFTTPLQKNMIIGTSRAAQGLQPKVFQDVLNKSIGNFAFTVAHSPFGPVYYESIKRKHLKENGGIFIIAVDPWSVSSWCSSPNNISDFRENELCLNNTKNVSMNPNFHYLFNNFSGKYNELIQSSNSMYLHDDGWLEVHNIKMDSAAVSNRTSYKLKTYRHTHLPKTKFSSVRVEYLVKTINYLKEYGEVYLVRLPIHESMMEIEDEIMPDFNFKIMEATGISNGYLDMTNQNNLFQYTDGNHLHKDSGAKVSLLIANWIKENE